MSDISTTSATDRDCLEAWRRHPGTDAMRPLVERYGAFVYSSAYRRSANIDQAREVTRAVFLVLARRARRLGRKTVLASWLFNVTAIACRKLSGRPKGWRRWFSRRPKTEPAADELPWTRVAPALDAALDRLPFRQRDAVLLRVLLHYDSDYVSRLLRINDRRIGKRVERGLRKMARKLRRTGVAADAEALPALCSAEACAIPLPAGLADEIFVSLDQTLGKRPSFTLARRTLNVLAWARWRRRFAVGIPIFVLVLLMTAGTAWYIDSLTGHSRFISMFFVWSVKHEAKTVPGMAAPARPWLPDANHPRWNAAGVRTARELYQTTNIWLAHLKFTRDQWDGLKPKRIAPLPHFFQPDGTVLLRHPEAQRSGLAGVLGFDFYWSSGDLEFGGVPFTNVAVRVKGNGSYLSSLYGDKRAFKVDLNRMTKGQKVGEADELTFNNLVNDHSFLSDALAYEFFREAGVPASRTAYAYLSATVERQWDRKPLGLYVMVEAVDEQFALERFGSKRTPLFKPVTYELFKYLGDDWSAYEAIYDLKTKATAEQQRRVIEFARLVTLAKDSEFAGRLGDFLDVAKFARYLACEVLLSNYDGFLSNGQNFYLYLDPGSNKFGFIPWDLDFAWGSFFLLGSTRERERASIWHPWVGRHRLMERIMAVDSFQRLYRAQLEDMLAQLFVPGRLKQRIDAVARVVRPPIAAESSFRLGKFEDAISEKRREDSSAGHPQGASRPAHQLKRFVEKRVLSVREQLDGKSKGIILERHPME